METIKNYLEAMFLNMPDTAEVKRAKRELMQMMEDKYHELISEGMNENTAIGTVISEFGNLEELAEELGFSINNHSQNSGQEMPNYRRIRHEDAKNYIMQKTFEGRWVGVGILLCICSPIMPILLTLFPISEAWGVAGLCFMVMMAVGMFIYSGMIGKEWNFLKDEPCQLDATAADYVKNERRKYYKKHAVATASGSLFCALCWLPAALLSETDPGETIGIVCLLGLVGVGVYLLVSSSYTNGSFETLLRLEHLVFYGNKKSSGKKQMSGSAGANGNTAAGNESKLTAALIAIFWPTVTCLYFIVSFLTFQWHITWIIWPIAGVIRKLLTVVFDWDEEEE